MQALLSKILEELKGAWRFRRHALALAWAACLVGWLGVLMMPDVYEANARIFVDTRTALTPVIQGLAIGQEVDAQLNYVQQSLLGTPQLEKVAREADLTFSGQPPEKNAAQIAGLRERIKLQASGGGGHSGGVVYTVTYQDSERARTLKVVDSLLNAFVEDTLGGKRTSSETAQKFLHEQIEDYEARLRAAEQRLADFKRQNVGVMPGAQGDYFARLQGEIEADRKAQTALAVATTRRAELARQLRGEVAFAPSVASTGSAAAPPMGTTAQRIKDTQTRLDEMLLRYTDKHPEVIALRETLAELQKRQQTEVEALLRGDPGAAVSTGATANPVFQSIQLALNQADAELAAMRGDIAERQVRIAQLRRMVDTVPKVEAEFARLNRDYDVTKAQYMALVDRLEKTRLGEEAQATGAVRFEVIDPPAAKFTPVKPKRAILVALVLFAGLGAGAGLAYVLHQLRPVFPNERVLSDVTGLPVLGIVSTSWPAKYAIEVRRELLRYSAAFATLLITFIVVMRYSSLGAVMLQRLLTSGIA